MAQWLTNPKRNHEVAGLIPGLALWVKDVVFLQLWSSSKLQLGPDSWPELYMPQGGQNQPNKQSNQEGFCLCGQPILEGHINGVIHHVTFCVWLFFFPPTVKFLRFIQVVACVFTLISFRWGCLHCWIEFSEPYF